MNNKISYLVVFISLMAFSFSGTHVIAGSPVVVAPVNPRAADSLRVDTVIGSMKALIGKLQKDILPKLTGTAKTNATLSTTNLKQSVKNAETQYKTKMKTPVMKLGETGKKLFRDMEGQVSSIQKNIDAKSELYQPVALAHIAIYKATQEMNPDSKIPMLATYVEPYDPNTTDNHQVTLIGAYLNFYLEYRLTVGGVEVGPDIVDAERVVFTFPEKLLSSITAPQYVEIKASPRKKTGAGKTARVEDYTEQTIYLLVYPVKK